MFINRSFYLLIVFTLLIVTACVPETPPSSMPASVPAGAITLRLAVADEEGRPSDPYVREFIEQAKTLSQGNITIEPIWDAGANTTGGFEKGTIELVTGGKADLGLAASRAWDTENVTSFQALQTPFLIDNDALAIAVAQSDVARRMLEDISSAGVVGLTLWPEDLRHPFSTIPDKPILSPDDFKGSTVRVTPSKVSQMLIQTFGGNPIPDGDYQAAESGLRQGFTLTGTPTATGNVNFFAKYQVLFANGTAFEELNDAQRNIIREAAVAAQKKAIAEHLSEADAAKAWCADGGTIVLASDEQIAAFEKAAQPIVDLIAQNTINNEMIASIRELKSKTKPSVGGTACASAAQASSEPSAETQIWSKGLPPKGVWQVELTSDDFIKMGTLNSTAADMAGVYTWTFQDGNAQIEIHGPRITVNCMVVATVIGEAVRLQNVASPDCDGNAYDDVQWRLDPDGLHFHLVSSQAAELRAMYETKPWHKTDQWSQGLPPNGVWQVQLTSEDVMQLGVSKANAPEWSGIFTHTFQNGVFHTTWMGTEGPAAGKTGSCDGTYEVVEDFVRITLSSECGNEVDDIQWRLDADGLHVNCIAVQNGMPVEVKAIFDAKPYQKIADP
jgi:TRAP-type transport system periplasmic protein